MARLFNDDEKERQRQALSALGSEAGGGGASMSSSSSGGSMGGGGGGGQVGTGVVNWDTYLGLNRGAGEQMGQGLVSDISTKGEGVKAGINQLSQEGASQVQAGGLGSAYSGPTSLQQVNPTLYGNLQSQASDVGAKARAAGGEGLGTLIREQYAPGQAYSGGQQAFDAFLTGATTGNELRGLGNKYGDFGSAFTGAEQDFAGQVDKARESTPESQPATPKPDADELRRRRRQMGVDVRTNPTGRG